MHVRKPLLRAAAPMGLLAVLAPASLAQTTWIYTSNNPTTAPPIVRDYASDTLIPSDPMAPGTFLGLSAASCLGPVTDPSKYEGGVAVDRTSSTVISTDGQRFAGGGGTTIQLEFQPTTPGSCTPGVTSCQIVKGAMPSSTILPGNAMLDPTRYYADVNVGTLPSVPGSAIPFNTQHVYFGQWVFMCGTGTPFNPTGAPFMASDPFRIAVSNPH